MIAIPEGWKDEWEKNVRRLYLCGRKHDMSIPDDQLDFMRDALVTMKDSENIIAQRDELLAALKTTKRTARLMHTAEQHETVCIEPQHWRALMEIMAKCEAQS